MPKKSDGSFEFSEVLLKSYKKQLDKILKTIMVSIDSPRALMRQTKTKIFIFYINIREMHKNGLDERLPIMLRTLIPACLHFYIQFVLESISARKHIPRTCIDSHHFLQIETERNEKQN